MKTRDDYLKQYQQLHDKKADFIYMDDRVEADTGNRLFNGRDFERNLWKVFKEWADGRESFRVCDYGSGKARFLHTKNLDGATFHESFPGKVQSYYCYDPGYKRFSKLPNQKFDAVICCDVMEHIRDQDVDKAILDMRFMLDADGVAFFNIGGNLSRIKFADGENTHINIQPAEYWREKLKLLNRRFYMRHVGVGIIRTYKAY